MMMRRIAQDRDLGQLMEAQPTQARARDPPGAPLMTQCGLHRWAQRMGRIGFGLD
jgi:hypothetical protein